MLPIAFFLLSLQKQAAPAPAPKGPGAAAASTARHFALRLRPGQDLLDEVTAFAKRNDLHAAAVVTCVGSLKHVTIRFANQPEGTRVEGPVEIVSLVGTFTREGGHFHISVSDSHGRTQGGHLMSGSAVFTTAEIVIAELDALTFAREKDTETTYDELVVKPRPKK